MRKSEPLAVRFWRYVEKTGTCWLWKGAKGRKGYGAIWTSAGVRRVHRVSYELAYGPIADGLMVCHTCDVPECVNPAHLFAGTAQDNVRDMYAKGRGTSVRRGDFCRRGHDLKEKGVIEMKRRLSISGQPVTTCRACDNERQRENYRRRKAA